MHPLGAAALRFVHQDVGALNQLSRELSCHATAVRDGPHAQADDADVDADGIVSEALVLAAPVVGGDRLTEPLGNLGRFDAAGELRDEETEFVAAEARVQVARFCAALDREEIVRTNLIGENPAPRAR